MMSSETKNNINANSKVYKDTMPTPLGMMYICATDNGICMLDFDNIDRITAEYKDIEKRLKTTIKNGTNVHIKQLKEELSEYFLGLRKTFDVSLDLVGTEFQKTVWQALKSIPFGKTTHYQNQAEQINKPKAVRAVASANGKNKISIVLPCHRVIGKNGKLTGYGGGLDRKKWLLDHESKYVNVQL